MRFGYNSRTAETTRFLGGGTVLLIKKFNPENGESMFIWNILVNQ
jgi:hypothetical protein